MDAIIGVLHAMSNLLTSPLNMLFVIIGVAAGCYVGAIPGLSGSMLISLTLPLTFYMNDVSSLTLLVSMYIGAISGGLVTAILLRIPGTPAAIITTFDGYPMAQNGRPGRAIGVGITASFIGGLVSWFFLVLISPLLSDIALKFGPFELFSMVLMALVLIASIGQGSFVKGLISGFLGLLIATPGIDPITSKLRLTFGFDQMTGGLALIPILIGMFGINQIVNELITVEDTVDRVPLKLKDMFLSFKEMKEYMVNFIRSSVIGTWIGILPGIGGNIGSIVAYSAAKNSSKTPEKFGTGIEDGIIASEAANNATINGALIPLLSLGIPGSIVTAILMGALVLHDVTPGPLLVRDNPDVFYGIISTAFIANVFMFIIMILTSVIIARIVDIPKNLLIPGILVFCTVGSFALNNRFFDVWLMFIFGLIGFVLEKAKYPLGPFIIGLVLSSIAEVNLRSSLMFTGGQLLPLLKRPISAVFILVAIGTLIWSLYKSYKAAKS